MTELKAGDSFPEGITFSYVPYKAEEGEVTACGMPETYDASAEFAKKVVLVSVPGAFTPTCQVSHLPGYMQKLPELRAKGVDQVIFIAFNDAWVMSAWGKANGVKDDSILFMCDSGTEFSKKIGWTLGERTGRFAMVVDHGKVAYAANEPGKGVTVSGADAVLAKL